jgi:hypothetical protein
LSDQANSILAIDYEEIVIQRAKQAVWILDTPQLQFLTVDFSSLHLAKKFNSIFLLENFLGMTLSEQKKIKMINQVENYLASNGIAVFAFRTQPDIPAGSYAIQVMPYQSNFTVAGIPTIYGLVINWTIGYFEKLLQQASTQALSLELIQGGLARPAGGRMYYAVLIKK